MTPFTIDVSQVYEDANNVTVNITVNTVAMTSITDLTLHVMLAEKLIEYNAPNGENEHPNVFRKALYGLGGESFTVPANGSSSNFETSYTFDPDWIKEDMEIIVFIQDESDKTVKQAAITPKIGTFNAGTPSAIKSLDDLNLSVYPNPVLNELNILGLNLKNTNYTITNIIGKEMKNGTISSNKIDVSLFEKGIYILKISKEEQNYYTKFYKN